MAIEMDQLLMMGGICLAVYFAGYQSLAVGIFIIMVFSSLLFGKKKVKAKGGTTMGGVTVKGAEMLEPIVIETTRGAPFRIPDYMKIRIKPNWGSNTWYEKAMGKGLGRMSRFAYRGVSGRQYGDSGR